MVVKDIFLAAKYIAILKGVKQISKSIFFEALHNFKIENDDFAKILQDLRYEAKSAKFEISEVEIKKAKDDKNSIDFNKDVKDFKRTFEEKGFDYNAKIGILRDEIKNKLAKIKDITAKLKDRIYSQDMAIDAVMSKLAGISTNGENGVSGIFFFLGPPATGKTEMAKTLRDFFSGYAFKDFSMGYYKSDQDAVYALVGSEKVWKDSQSGELTSFVKDHPRSILLFDEVEKSHIDVQDIFLDILGDGMTSDKYTGELIDFKECIFVFTSNVGNELYSNPDFLKKFNENALDAQDMIFQKLISEKNSRGEKLFKAEFLSRLSQGEIVLFNRLNFEAYTKIAEKILNTRLENFKKEYVNSEFADKNIKNKLIKILILNMLPNFDARTLQSKFSQSMFKILQDYLIDNIDKDINKLIINISDECMSQIKKEIGKISIDEFIQNCFRKNQKINLTHNFNFENGILYFTYEKAELKKIPKTGDFGGIGSILVDLPDICFKDIAGHDKVKARLKEVASLLLNKDGLKKFKAKAPRGMLLYGPPGTGKTMLAKAFAHEADLPFIKTTGTEILDIELMQKIFKRAREYAPAIIFIDEIDVFGRRDAGSRFDVQINQFLTEINGFDESGEIFIIAATNIIDKIDPAILRSGRIDLKVEVGMLDPAARGYFIDKILELPTIGKIDKEKLIKFSSFMSGADLTKVKREAVYEVLRRGLDGISEEILLEQINTIKYGEKVTSKNIQNELFSTAYHEAGHAVISHILRPNIKIEQITVMPRNKSLGFVSYNNDEIPANSSFDDIKNKILISFAGRVAEKKFAGESGVNTGASNDLEQASDLAFWAVRNLGMSDIGYVNLKNQTQSSYLSELIDKKVLEILNECKEKCEKLVDKNWSKIEKIAKILIEKEMIDENEFLNVIKKGCS